MVFSLDPILEGGCSLGGVAAALLLSSNGGGIGLVDGGIFHRITMTSMTGAWYLTINNFEAIIVGLVILEIFVLRYLLILPLDFTKWIEQGILLQTAVSRKKRKKRSIIPSFSPGMNNTALKLDKKELEESIRLMDTLLTAVERLDKEDCLLKALCVLEGQRMRGSGCGQQTMNEEEPPLLLPSSIIQTLAFLKGFHLPPPAKWPKSPAMSLLQDAVRNGGGGGNYTNSTSTGTGCSEHYPKCTLSPEEINTQLQIYFSVLNSSE